MRPQLARKALWAAGPLLALAVMGSPAAAESLREIFSRPIAVTRTAAVAAIPFEVRGGKLFLTATVNGEAREFIFDTGSPTILSRALADALGLKPVGRNTGRDANGAPVEMEVAVVERLTLGSVTFSNVPVLIHDFSSLATGACLMDGGVIGSEILAGGAWRIDAGAGRLETAADAASLGGGAGAVTAKLYDFGYPHAPIVDYRVGAVSDKALFDTGSAAAVTLFRGIADQASVKAAMAPGSVRKGRGSEGESAGGAGAEGPLMRFSLTRLELGEGGQDGALSDVRTAVRGAPPSLIGAGVLASHVVTLDYPGGRFVMAPRAEPAAPPAEAGYAIAYRGEGAVVAQLYEGSAAARAGLKLNDRVVEAAGRPLAGLTGEARCAAVRWLVGEFNPAEATRIVVERDGKRVGLEVPGAEAR